MTVPEDKHSVRQKGWGFENLLMKEKMMLYSSA